MSAAELRKAAETLRSLAADTLPAPWTVRNDSESLHDVQSESCGHVPPPNGHVSEAECDEWGVAVAAADLLTGACMLGDALYIAAVHPGVGLALADLLEEAQSDFHDMGAYDTCTSIGSAALTIARLINGGGSDD